MRRLTRFFSAQVRSCRMAGLALALMGNLIAAPVAATAPLAGGVRPLRLELDGAWIGQGVAFSPYRRGQEPGQKLPTENEIRQDLHLVSRYWKLIRMYDSSAVTATTLAVIRRDHLPIRMVLGAWLAPATDEASRLGNRTQLEGAIRLANEFRDLVIAVNVGNETRVEWSGHRVDQVLLIDAIRQVRAAITQPVTTADDFNFWNKDEAKPVAAEVDFIMMHAYALWNGRSLAEAIDWTAGIYDGIVRRYPGKPVIIGETGWATSHDASRQKPGEEGALIKAPTTLAAQETYLRQHYRWVREHKVATLLFEAFDEPWKGGGETASASVAEKHWGVFDEHRQAKPSFSAILREYYPALPAPAQP